MPNLSGGFSGRFSALKDVPELPEGVSLNEYRSWQNQIVRVVAANQFEVGLSLLGYPDGFYDVFLDQSKIASSSNVNITTGQNSSIELTGSTLSSNTGSFVNQSKETVAYDVDVAENGIISTLKMYNACGTRDCVVRVKDSSNNVLVSKTQSVTGDTIGTFNLTISDYSEILQAGNTYTVEVETPNVGCTPYITGFSDSNSYYSISNQDAPCTQDSSISNFIVFKKFDSNGSVTSTDQDLGYSGSELTLTADYDSPNAASLSFDLLDSTGSIIETVSEAQIGETISISTSDTVYALRANLSSSGSTPILRKYEAGIDD